MNDKYHEIHLKDMVEAITRIESYISDLDYEAFTQDNLVIDAVLRNLEILGEAAGNIPKDIKREYDHIPWRRIAGLGGIVIHEYFGVDLENIWKIITEDIAYIKPSLVKIIPKVRPPLPEIFEKFKASKTSGAG